jgi:hypothetical protein
MKFIVHHSQVAGKELHFRSSLTLLTTGNRRLVTRDSKNIRIFTKIEVITKNQKSRTKQISNPKNQCVKHIFIFRGAGWQARMEDYSENRPFGLYPSPSDSSPARGEEGRSEGMDIFIFLSHKGLIVTHKSAGHKGFAGMCQRRPQ